MLLYICYYIYSHVNIYRLYMSQTYRIISCEQTKRIKLNKKVTYHFAIFTIVNEILISKRSE